VATAIIQSHMVAGLGAKNDNRLFQKRSRKGLIALYLAGPRGRVPTVIEKPITGISHVTSSSSLGWVSWLYCYTYISSSTYSLTGVFFSKRYHILGQPPPLVLVPNLTIGAY
jgi:hypothetical protein